MDRKVYEKMTEEELKGRKVKTRIPFTNGWGTIPAGTVCIITKKFGGLHLRTDLCPHCGLTAIIGKIQPGDVELLLNDPPKKFSGIIRFVDDQQDCLEWGVINGEVVTADMQKWVWLGTKVHNETIKPGDTLIITLPNKRERTTFRHLVEKAEVKDPEAFKSALELKDYMTDTQAH